MRTTRKKTLQWVINDYIKRHQESYKRLEEVTKLFEQGLEPKEAIVRAMNTILIMDDHILNDPHLNWDHKAYIYKTSLREEEDEKEKKNRRVC